jgi:hypothetical protein
MWKRLSSLRAILVTLPLAVAVRVPSTESETTVSLEGGTGQYVSVIRDCNGSVVESHDHPFEDAAIEVARWSRPYRFGLRYGWARTDDRYWSGSGGEPQRRGFYYGQPFFAAESTRYGLMFGAVIGDRMFLDYDPDDPGNQDGLYFLPAFRLRLGDPHDLALVASLHDNIAIYSGGGAFDLGVAKQTQRHGLYAGLSGGGLYEGVGLMVRVDRDIAPEATLHLNGRWGTVDSTPEYALGGGVTFRFGQRYAPSDE